MQYPPPESLLETLPTELGPIREGTYHELTVDVVKFAAEGPGLLQIVDFELEIRRHTVD
jgi:hypothetical protein